MIKVGDVVIWVDPVARQHNALVTAVWSEQCINVVHVSGDVAREDSYGRQLERHTSQQHKSMVGGVHGNYWMLPGDEANPVTQPLEK